MKKFLILLFFSFVLLSGYAQVSKNSEGLYVNENGTLFTGKLNQKLENAQSLEVNIVDGKEEGSVTYFYASGKTMEKGKFSKGLKEGEWIRFSENGNTIGIANYLFGKKHGEWLVYGETGNKLFEMRYENGEKAGNWKQYDIAGKLIHSYDYTVRN